MARRSSRSDQPQSNTVLIVFLVFSILLNLGLGVFLYLAQDKITKAEGVASTSKSERDNIERQRNAATNVVIPLLQKMIGFNVPNDKVGVLNTEFRAATDSKVIPQSVEWINSSRHRELMQPAMIGPPVGDAGLPTVSLMDKVIQLAAQVTSANQKVKETESRIAALTGEFDTYKKQWNAQDYSAKLKAAQDAFDIDLKNKLKQKDDVIADMNKRMQDITNDVLKQFTDASNEFKQKLLAQKADFDGKVKELELERKEERKRLEITQTVALNVPKAYVISVDPNSDRAFIGIGSDLKVPLQLTLAIHGHDTSGNAHPKPKAEVEVIRVLGPQLSEVRIKRIVRPDAERLNISPESNEYWITDPRDFARTTHPIYKGDYAYNTIWDPNRRIRVALVGDFDLDGDGTDDVQAFMNVLRSQGADIDLYLDKAANYQPRGKLSFATDLVVVGGVNPITTLGAIDQRLEGKGTELIKNAEKLQKEALEKGVEILTLPRFLNRIGFSSARSLSPRAANGTAPAAPAAAPAGAETAPAGEKTEPKNN